MTDFALGGPLLFRSYTAAPPLDRFIENFWPYQGYASPHVKERILQDGTFKAIFSVPGCGVHYGEQTTM